MLFESMLVIGSMLLIASGGAKWADGGPTSGALRAAGMPSSRSVVRLVATAEVLAGAAALVVDHPMAPLSVASLYAAFAAFVGWALLRGIPLQSCGCFGRSDTPPTSAHVIVNVALAASAVAAAGSEPLFDRFLADPLPSTGVVVFAAIAVYLLYLILAELPVTLAAARRGPR